MVPAPSDLDAGWAELGHLGHPDPSTDAVGILHQRYEMTTNPQVHSTRQVHRAARLLFTGVIVEIKKPSLYLEMDSPLKSSSLYSMSLTQI